MSLINEPYLPDVREYQAAQRKQARQERNIKWTLIVVMPITFAVLVFGYAVLICGIPAWWE